MKRAINIILLITMISGLLAACQQTPESPIVIGKGDQQLEEKLLQIDTLGEQADLPQNGERIACSFSNKNKTIQVNVDATIACRNSDSMPAVKVCPQKFSQEQADTIIRVLSGGAELYSAAPSKESIEKRLLEMRRMAELEGGGIYDEIIADLELQYRTAQNAKDVTVSTEFRKAEATSAISEEILVRFDRGRKSYIIRVQNSDDGKLSQAEMYSVGDSMYVINADASSQEYVVDISYENAELQANEINTAIQTGLTLHSAYIVSDDATEADDYAYQFIFTREINGTHTVYEETNAISGNFSEESEQLIYQEPWPHEFMRIVIDEDGVQEVSWKGQQLVLEDINEDVILMPYPEIMGIFQKMLLITNTRWETFLSGDVKTVSVDVNKITLGLMRVQSGSDYYLIPVWDFWGSVAYLDIDGNNAMEKRIDETALFRNSLKSLITINAIDGSIIDRALGY